MTFEDFASRNIATLLRFSTALTNDRGLGEDLVQQVLLRAMTRWRDIEDLDQPIMYVRRMLINEFLTWRRKWARITPTSDLFGAHEPSSPDNADEYSVRADLLERLARLPRKQRAVIALRYLEDLADDDIAEILRCSPATVRSQAMRALRTLRIDIAADRSVPYPALTRRTP
jgi:RNA polymerase sigma-70 factor (sigma-E family)